jgi:hypothetical protein
MSQNGGRTGRWRKRIAVGESSLGPGLALVEALPGVLVSCPKTGLRACIPYRAPRVYTAGDVRYYLKCRACHDKHYISEARLTALLKQAMPAANE